MSLEERTQLVLLLSRGLRQGKIAAQMDRSGSLGVRPRMQSSTCAVASSRRPAWPA
jgi:hypothetical protein